MRTEQEVLKDFENLGYEVIDTKSFVEMTDYNSDDTIHIDIKEKNYSKYNGNYYPMEFTLQEHKLLTDLFKIWRWL